MSDQPLYAPATARWSGEFTDKSLERAYRQSQSAAEVRQCIGIWLLGSLFFLLYAPSDYYLSATLSRSGLLGWRLVICATGITAVVLVLFDAGKRYRDSISSVALGLISICYAFISAGHSQAAGASGALILLVVGIYLFSPGRFWWICLNGIGCSLLPPLVEKVWQQPVWVLFLYSYLMPANLLAAIVLSQLNRVRRQNYLHARQLQDEIAERKRAQAALAVTHERNVELLYNTLPPEVARQLARQPDYRPARLCSAATVLFADLVGFTRVAQQMSAADLLQMLDRLFSRFDQLAEGQGIERIKTLGDAYLAAAGVTGEQNGQQPRAAALALAQMQAVAELAAELQLPLQLRVGIHCGPVICGVIGTQRLAFDIWGETVNVASRLQEAATPGHILVSAAVRGRCGDGYRYGPRRELVLRGCGPVAAVNLYAGAGPAAAGSVGQLAG